MSQLLEKKPKTKTIEIKNYSFKNREKASSFNINNTSNIYMYGNTKTNNNLKISIFLLPLMFTISHVRRKKKSTLKTVTNETTG